MSAIIRRARAGDAAELARLSGELGYRATADEIARRLAVLLADRRHLVAVAAGEGALRALIHVEQRCSLESGERAELIALVVDARWRRSGLGRDLVALAGAWTAARGIASMVVRSNVARAESHPFYESLGYARSKTQHVYTKSVTIDAAAARTLQSLDAEA